MPDDLDLERVRRGRALRREDGLHGGDRDEHDDDGGQGGPQQLEPRTAVDLRRRGLPGALAETHHHVGEQREHEDEDADRPPGRVHEHAVERVAELGDGSKRRLCVLLAITRGRRRGYCYRHKRAGGALAGSPARVHCIT